MTEPIRPISQERLAVPYDQRHVYIEYVAIVVFFLIHGWLCWGLYQHWEGVSGWAVAFVGFLGWLGGDLISGVVHWMADTWGSVDWPWIGPNVIRTFRHHHVDPKHFTQYKFFRVSGSNALVSLLVLVPGACIPLEGAHYLVHASIWWLVTMTGAVFLTNIFHRWAHEDEPPRWVRALQRWRLILSPEHHAIHHTPPYDRHYCITTGWMNPLLEAIGFFPRMERLVTWVTGALPRAEDLGDDAARAVAQEKGIDAMPVAPSAAQRGEPS